jgi:hypothetical protein
MPSGEAVGLPSALGKLAMKKNQQICWFFYSSG